MDAFLRGLFGLNHHQQQQHGEQPPQQQGHARGGKGGVRVAAAAAGTAAAVAAQPAAAVISPPPAAIAAAAAAALVSSDAGTAEEAASWMLLDDENARKRSRASASSSGSSDVAGYAKPSGASARSGGARTPGLVLSPRYGEAPDDSEEDDNRPVKRFRGERGSVIPVSPLSQNSNGDDDNKKKKAAVSPLKLLPDDLLAHCLSFLGGVEDRFSIQATSKQFRKLSNADAMRKNIQVGGDKQTGLHGIIREHDTPESASKNLDPFVQAGNLEAIYMYVYRATV
jgi:hypothetical protein